MNAVAGKRGGVRRAARWIRWVGAAALLVVVAVVADEAAAQEATWHAETLTTSPNGLHVTHYWSKGNDRLRAETVFAGQRLVTIINGDRYYAVNVTSGQAIAIKRSKRAIEEGKKRRRLMGLEGFVIRERGGEKVKSESLAGRMCDLYQNTDARGRRQVWVQQQDAAEMLPMRVEVYDRQSAALIRTDFIQWASGLELAERLFVPDPRIPIEEFSYEDYVARSGSGVPLVPVLHSNLLHGEQ